MVQKLSSACKVIALPLMVGALLTGCAKDVKINALCPEPLVFPVGVEAYLRKALMEPRILLESVEKDLNEWLNANDKLQCDLAACRGEDLTGCGG